MTGRPDIDALKTALAAAEARAANAEAKVSDAAAEIAFLRLTIEKLRREMYGWRSERKQRLLDQLELQLDELEASATEDELAAERAASGTTQVEGFTRRRSGRKPFPAHLPRERVVVPGPISSAVNTLAYNLGNFMRTLALPKEVEHWSMTTLRDKLVKIGAKVVRHGRYVTFQLAEVAVPRDLFRKILSLIDDLRRRPAPA